MDKLKPQQEAFLKAYIDPKSPTWGNALQSGLKVGYDEDYSRNILNQMPDWLRNNLDKTRLIQKAERNLELALDGLLDDPEKGAKVIQNRATEFTLSRLKKDEYSDRIEHTGKNGEVLRIVFDEAFKDKNETI